MKLWQRLLGGEKGLSLPAGMGHSFLWPSSLRGNEEPPLDDFERNVLKLFAANPVVWGAVHIRKAVFSQARFMFEDIETGALTRNESLRLLERPWVGGTTAKLLTRTIQHADLGGNGYALKVEPKRLQLMRPDRVTIVMGSKLEPEHPGLAEDAELVGYMYMPHGRAGSARFYLPEQVGHFAPEPDPLANWRGMSWLTPVIREVMADKETVRHKEMFFKQAATPNMIIRFDPSQTLAQVKAFKELVEEDHAGVDAAYKTLYLGGGADATVVGANLQQLDFARTIGKAETRILMAAGVHPVIAGASEGMQGASLNAGNFGQVRRLFSDIHLQDLWNEVAASFETLVDPPEGARLVTDGRKMPFLQQDQTDLAEIQRTQARAITTLVRDGFTAESATAAVIDNDMSKLVHTGLLSVQLQPPMTEQPEEGEN